MNQRGFTTVEALIASALIITMITAGAVGFRQMNLLTQVATTRTAHVEIRDRVLSVLANSGACAANIGNPTIPLGAGTDTRVGIPVLRNGSAVVMKSNDVVPDTDGLVYDVALRFPWPNAYQDFPAGAGRATPTRRFAARLEIRGKRERMKEMGSSAGDLVGSIPLYVEANAFSGAVVSCTTQLDRVDDVLVAGAVKQHTVRDCLAADGFPMPTDMGLICRIPIPDLLQLKAGYPAGVGPGDNGIPDCSTLADGTWRNASATNPNYNTTLPNDLDLTGRTCPGDPKFVTTGWHSFSKNDVEPYTARVKKGTSATLSVILGGAAFTALVVVAMVPVVGTIIAAAVAVVAFVVSLFKKCKREDFRYYAQVTGVGCV